LENKELNVDRLSEEERDKLLLNMASAMLDLSQAITALAGGIELLLFMITNPGPVGHA